MHRFLNKLFFNPSKHRDYEQFCLDALRGGLAPEGQSILDAQLASLGSLTRSFHNKMVLFDFRDRTAIPIFPNTQPELHVARLLLASLAGDEVRCDVIFYEGRLSSLEFHKPPQTILAGSCMLVSQEFFADLMTPATPQAGNPSPETPHLNALRSRLTITNVQPPATDAQIATLFGRLLTAAPDDYAALLRETNGFTCGDGDFHGVDIRRQVDWEANYLYLAQSTAFAVALREGAAEARYVLHDQVHEEFTDLGTSFVDAFEKMIAAQIKAEME